jgi:NDP-sugar pyrophosphorylase family protein
MVVDSINAVIQQSESQFIVFGSGASEKKDQCIHIFYSNHKNLFDGYSWDIITNFEKEPDINLINQAIEKSKTSIKKENYWIDIGQLDDYEIAKQQKK